MLEKLKQIGKFKSRYDYYAAEANHKKTFTAKIVDSFSLFMIFIAILFFITVILFRSILLPSILVTVLFGVFLILFYLHIRQQYEQLRELAYSKIRLEKLNNLLDNISQETFQLLILDVLSENQIFQNIVIGNKYIEGFAQNSRYIIGYDRVEPNSVTSWRTVEEFINSIQHLRHRDIIYFTNMDFENTSYILKDTYRNFTIYLLNRDSLIELLKDSQIVIEDSQLREEVDKKYNHTLHLSRAYRYNPVDIKRVRSMFLYSTIFISLSLLNTNYSMYYRVVSIIFFILAISCLIFNRTKPKKPNNILEISKKIGS